jgi:hypothetical protein
MELIEVKSLIWAPKGKFYKNFKNVMLFIIGLLKVGFLLGFIGWNLQTQR